MAKSKGDRCKNFWIFGICILVWLHGATFGATLGEGVVIPFLFGSFCVFTPIMFLWTYDAFKRLIVSFLYFLGSAYLMALISSLAWFRNPAHLPPLPDIFHDMLPIIDNVQIPFWHTEPHLLPDLFITSLTISTIAFIVTHRQRWIILRRFFVVYGTLMCMRSVTLVVTNIPDALPKCHEITRFHHWSQIDSRSVILRALKLLAPVGEMTCGDMVFSGHSMILCLHAMVWQTYYKRKPGLQFNFVKLFVWGWALLGLFSILAVRLHYTLDVLLAVYFSVTVWSAYHRIAHDVAVGHHFSMIWLIDHVLVYPAIRWLELPVDVDALSTLCSPHHSHLLHTPNSVVSFSNPNLSLLKKCSHAVSSAAELIPVVDQNYKSSLKNAKVPGDASVTLKSSKSSELPQTNSLKELFANSELNGVRLSPFKDTSRRRTNYLYVCSDAITSAGLLPKQFN